MVHGYVQRDGDGMYVLVVEGREVAWTTDPRAAERDLSRIVAERQRELEEREQRGRLYERAA